MHNFCTEICTIKDVSQFAGVGMIHKQFGHMGGKGSTVKHMNTGKTAAQILQGYGDIFKFAAGGDPVTVAAPDGGDHEYLRLGIKRTDFVQESF